MKTIAVLSLVLALVGARAVRADIFEWQDADGVRHFTNSKDDVPSTESPQVVVAERTVPASSNAVAPPPAAAADPPREAQVIYDTNQLSDAYLEGLQQGLALAHGGGSSGVTINGPLAIAGGGSSGSSWNPYYASYYPLVTTSFDHGRSRHRTLRMLLQDQFQIDRDGPFAVERIPPGLGPNLSPFLPRGLPGGFPMGQRVLFY